MSLDKLEQSVRKSARAEIEKIKKQTEVELEAIKNKIKSDAARECEKYKARKEHEIKLLEKRILADARMKAKTKTESEKTKLIDSVFLSVRDKILGLDKKQKTKILQKLAQDGKKGVQNPVVYVDSKYRDLIPAKSRNIGDFGVIIESKDGSVSVDNTLSSVLARMRPALEPKIVQMLFK